MITIITVSKRVGTYTLVSAWSIIIIIIIYLFIYYNLWIKNKSMNCKGVLDPYKNRSPKNI